MGKSASTTKAQDADQRGRGNGDSPSSLTERFHWQREFERDWVKVDIEDVSTSSVGYAGDGGSEWSSGSTLDEDEFPRFAPLLLASQAYARTSGCRFRGSDFYGLLGENTMLVEPRSLGATSSAINEAGTCQFFAARLRAAPEVARFAELLKVGELGLVEELESAYDVVMRESVRNAMVAAFRALGLWPPSPTPPGIDINDCDFEDLSAPMPDIAQRAYNDYVKRGHEAATTKGCGLGKLLRRASTASYLVDFAFDAGIQPPSDCERNCHASRLQRFGELVQQWEREHDDLSVLAHAGHAQSNTPKRKPWRRSVKSIIASAVFGETRPDSDLNARKWCSKHLKDALWSFTTNAYLSASASASISILQRTLQDEDNILAALENGDCGSFCSMEQQAMLKPAQEEMLAKPKHVVSH